MKQSLGEIYSKITAVLGFPHQVVSDLLVSLWKESQVNLCFLQYVEVDYSIIVVCFCVLIMPFL